MPRTYRIKEITTAVLFLAYARLVSAQGFGPTPVSSCPITERDVPATIKLVGTVLPDKHSVIASEVAGPITLFDAEAGDFLKKGDVICKLDGTVAKFWLTGAEAQLENLRQKLKEYENGTRPEELRRLKASLQEAQAWYDRWEFEYKRMQDLFERNMGNPTERHNTEMEYTASRRRLEQAKASLELAENGTRAEVISQARADVAGQEATVARLKHGFEKTEVRAPFDGFIVDKRSEVGEWIEEGGAVVVMVGIETVRVRADVPESAISFAKPDAPASIEVEAMHSRFAAPIKRVIPQASAGARTFPIEIELKNAEHKLLPGMFVWAHVPNGPSGKRLMVHKDAVTMGAFGAQVFVIRTDDKGASTAMPVSVTTGLELGNEIEISGAGLNGGDSAVCRANERLFGPTPVIASPMVSNTKADTSSTGVTRTAESNSP